MTARQAAEQHGAQMYLPHGIEPDTAVLFYRWAPEINHCGEIHKSLQFLNFNNSWQASFTHEPEEEYARLRLIQIDGVPPYDHAVACRKLISDEMTRMTPEQYRGLQAARERNRREEQKRSERRHRP